MKTTEHYMTVSKICDRAEKLGIAWGTRLTSFMDIDHAAETFGLRLEDMLNADDMNFAHDFNGIQSHIDRSTGTFYGGFVPRFASIV